MIPLLFSAQGRIGRGRFWLGACAIVGLAIAAFIVVAGLWQVIPGTVENGEFHVEGLQALPYGIVTLGWLVAAVWAGICLGIKRFHDRNKSGAWILVQFVPLIGSLWYFVEAGCLRGTDGPNVYGPDPLAAGPVALGVRAGSR